MKKEVKIKSSILIATLVIILLVSGYFILYRDAIDYGDNGIWDNDKKECLPREETDGFFQCCFNYEGQQVDCRDAKNILGGTVFAIYKGTPGIGSVSQGIKISNTGNVDISAVLESFTWTASPSSNVDFLNTAWASIRNVPKSIPQGTYQSWSTPLINVQANCPSTLTTYTINAGAKATTTIEGISYDSTTSKQSSFTCTKESISFNFDINF